MKKLNVNKEACIGCGACVAIDSEHFDFGDDGLSEAISQENLDSENVANAISSCPTNAISIVEAEGEEKECCQDETEEKECCSCCKDKECCCNDEENEDEDYNEDEEEAA